MPWTTAISTGLNVLGGIMGNKSSGAAKEARHIQWDNYQTAKDLAYNGIQRRVEDAQKAGIHPVYALGGQTAQFTPSVAAFTGQDNSTGSALRDMGAGVQRAAEVADAKVQERLARRLMESQIEGQELENAKKASDLRLRTAAGTPPNLGVSDELKQRLAKMDTPLGSNTGALPLHQIAYDEEGHPFQFLNPDLEVESEVAQAAHFLMYTAPQWLWNKTGGRSLSKKLSKRMSRKRPTFDKKSYNPYRM